MIPGGLITAITTFLAGRDAGTLNDIHETLDRAIGEAGPEALARLSQRLADEGADWTFYPSDPLARRVHHLLAEWLVPHDSAIFGIEHLAAVDGRPLVIIANHLSYSDANLLEVLLHRAGADSLGDRLTVIAGPKVYSDVKRRFSSLCFGTIKMPQSNALSTDEAVMDPRQAARAARQGIDIAHERIRLGDALLVFAEGTRSRTRGMQSMLAGVARYLDVPGTCVLPIGLTGAEAWYPIGEETLHPVRIVARIGAPIEARVLRERANGDRRLMMDAVGLAVAELLPPEYRGAYADDVRDLDDARRLVSSA